jgi:hypothetical protein
MNILHFLFKPLAVAMGMVKCLRMSSIMRPGYVMKSPAVMALSQVDLTGLKQAQWR